jgi:hypothetical protein
LTDVQARAQETRLLISRLVRPSVVGWVTGRSACVFYGRTGPAYN